MESKITSRKLWVTIIALVVILVVAIFIPANAAESMSAISKIVIVYLGGQGAVDVSKQLKKKQIIVGDEPQ